MEHENGELRQLLEIKRAYRTDLTSLEEELKAKFERELADGKKRLKEEYLEKVVDTVFAEPAEVAVEVKDATVKIVPEVEIKTEVTPAPSPPVTSCPECGTTVDVRDKFCPQCAFPLRDESETVGTAGRTRPSRVSGTSASARRTRLARGV
jgi:hypothetical protein